MDSKEPWPAASPIWNGEEVRDLLFEGNEIIQLRCKPEEQKTDDPTQPESPPFSANVHKKLLCNFSDRYRAIFPRGVSESGSSETKSDLPSKLARTFVLWLYSGQLANEDQEVLLPLYVFALKIGSLALRRTIMTELSQGAETMTTLPRFKLIQETLVELPITSALRKFLLDKYIHHWVPTWQMFYKFENRKHEAGSTNFFEQVMVAMIARNETLMIGNPETGDLSPCPCCHRPCNYHEHDTYEDWKETCGSDFLWRDMRNLPSSALAEIMDQIRSLKI